MTHKAKKNLKSLCASTKRYSPTVQKKLSRGNRKPNEALVASAAKYYIALKELAKG